MATNIPNTLKDVLNKIYKGCNVSALPSPEKLRTVIWWLENCDVPCWEAWACGQAVTFPTLTSEPIQHDQLDDCDDGSVRYVQQSPNRTITVENFSHEFYWRKGRAKQIKQMKEDGDIDFWGIQTFSADGSNEAWVFRGFPVSFGKNASGSRDTDPAMLPIELAITGRVEIVEDVKFETCGAGDAVLNTEA